MTYLPGMEEYRRIRSHGSGDFEAMEAYDYE